MSRWNKRVIWLGALAVGLLVLAVTLRVIFVRDSSLERSAKPGYQSGTVTKSLQDVVMASSPDDIHGNENTAIHLFRLWAAEDAAGAAAYADEVGVGLQTQTMIADFWSTEDPEAAALWILEKSDAQSLASRVAALTASWARSDIFGASRFVQALPSGKAQQEGAASVASNWAQRDAHAAGQWVLSLPDEGARVAGALQIVPHLAAKSQEEADEWIRELPEGRVREAAQGIHALWYAGKNPAEAFAMVRTLSDPVMRDRRERQVAALWLERSPESALAGLLAANFVGERFEEALMYARERWAEQSRATSEKGWKR